MKSWIRNLFAGYFILQLATAIGWANAWAGTQRIKEGET